MPFIRFSWLIAVARTYIHMVNEGAESCILVLFLILDDPVPCFSFSLLRVMLAVVLSYMAVITIMYITSIHNLLSFFSHTHCILFLQEVN